MTFQAAIRTGKPLRLKGVTFEYQPDPFSPITYIIPDFYIDSEFLLGQIRLTKDQVLSKEWEVQK